ncbi:NACHT and WD40 domain protein [Purpureocillium lavendulum]|uniref:NACHT and WD40 domain protein n=1 Tax=Purpureocillium lavendulum TaxID=1247861 RepID=A0AB34FL87_9HYPO|nr:NACHT and WD40 domain protein [Purpureocillium lavendulum]
MLRRKESFAVVTPIPRFVPRQLAIDSLHAHNDVITLNPLVLSHRHIPPPRTAITDEYFSDWYEIVQRIQYVPAIGRPGSGQISFKGCFHNMPWGLQTHVYAPMNVDLRNEYYITENQPATEQFETRERPIEVLEAPKHELYLCNDIQVECNIAMMRFVKAQLTAANKEMVQRIVKKAGKLGQH